MVFIQNQSGMLVNSEFFPCLTLFLSITVILVPALSGLAHRAACWDAQHSASNTYGAPTVWTSGKV